MVGDEAEAEAWAISNGHPEPTNVPSIARSIARLPKANPTPPRIVIVTHGAESTTVVSAQNPNAPRNYPVQPLREEDIIDTNAAGDAFAGTNSGSENKKY